jgi:integrase
MTTFRKQMTDALARYVELRRALGCAFTKQAAVLRDFGRFVARRPEAGRLTQELVLAYVLGCDVTPNERQRRYRVLQNFGDYFAIFDPRTPPFDPHALPRSRAVPPVRILDDEELRRLLDAATTLSPQSPTRGQTLHAIIGLLASTGLRSGEVVRLDRDDVDLTSGILRIRRTKFRKDRLVPTHPTTLKVLRRYAKVRDRAYPKATSPGFFLSLRGGRLSAAGLNGAFRVVAGRAGLDRGLPRAVRPHDLRHRFAVTRVVTWHRQRLDVQARLPLLATYLGHAHYSDTAYYITGTPELLGQAAGRAFGRRGGVR